MTDDRDVIADVAALGAMAEGYYAPGATDEQRDVIGASAQVVADRLHQVLEESPPTPEQTP